MKLKSTHKLALVAAATAFAGSAMAAVSAEEAKQLGTTLTTWGAEVAGNKDGSIPAYTGTRAKATLIENEKTTPANFNDPYANEKPLYSITAQNMAQYAGLLTDGQTAMFKKYPNFRMDVYPTHRTAIWDKWVQNNMVKNATACKTANDGQKLTGCYGGVPFPIPKTGNEAVWSHIMSHPAYNWGGHIRTFIVDTSGKMILNAEYYTRQTAPYLAPEMEGKVLPEGYQYWWLRFDAKAPARRISENTIIIDPLDPRAPGRRAWTYVPGQRRVKLAPDLAYDTPSPASGGASTMDEQRLFLGALDRYDFKLIGKKEVLLQYNEYKMTDYRVCPNEVSHTKNFANPDCSRWEKHRAWVVEAKIKPGIRHSLPRRVLYFDEDTWAAGIADSWDAANSVYRIDSCPMIPFGDQPTGQIGGDYTWTYDLQTGLVSSTVGVGFKGGNYPKIAPVPEQVYSPEALAGEGVR